MRPSMGIICISFFFFWVWVNWDRGTVSGGVGDYDYEY